MDISIISMESCDNKEYGNSLIQYKYGTESIGFLFSQVDISESNRDFTPVLEEIEMREKFYRPSWKEIPEALLDAILEAPFDMKFIEYDRSGWSQKLADEILEKVAEISLEDTVEPGDAEECFITVYAGAMCEINWTGHSIFGRVCLGGLAV